MSVDRSLRTKSALERHRNVLSRSERVERLMEQDRFEEGMSPLGLPKVAHRRVAAGKKTKKKAGASEEES